MIPLKQLVGDYDILFITLDTLRYDVACQALSSGKTPHIAALLPDGWEKRHSPASFTYAAHHAFFAGFLPTPAEPGRHPRHFAARFEGSMTSDDSTVVFDAPDIVTGFKDLGYHTVCIGGVGFFNKLNPLGSVLPGLFDESHWSPDMGVTSAQSTENQVELALSIAANLPAQKRLFLFLNISALHQPNCIFTPGATTDCPATQEAALVYVDQQLGRLFDELSARAPLATILCSDHGTAYGEDGFMGHRLAHEVVWTVPYAEFMIARSAL